MSGHLLHCVRPQKDINLYFLKLNRSLFGIIFSLDTGYCFEVYCAFDHTVATNELGGNFEKEQLANGHVNPHTTGSIRFEVNYWNCIWSIYMHRQNWHCFVHIIWTKRCQFWRCMHESRDRDETRSKCPQDGERSRVPLVWVGPRWAPTETSCMMCMTVEFGVARMNNCWSVPASLSQSCNFCCRSVLCSLGTDMHG